MQGFRADRLERDEYWRYSNGSTIYKHDKYIWWSVPEKVVLSRNLKPPLNISRDLKTRFQH